MQTLWLRRIALASAFACAGRAAAAQSIRGVVADSQSGRPIAGAVVLLMNAGGFVVNRTVTSELGAYTIRRDSLAVKGQVLRLGFRPRIISAAELASADASGELSIRIVAIPQLLEPMTSRAGASCPKRRDRAAAFGFWEQAKAGLMASVYARDSSPGFFSTLIYEKYLTRNTDSVTLQRVRADSGMWPRTFFAAFTAKDFVDVGFLRNTGDGKATYFGPDAEVLLESDFQTRYCFSLAARDPKRPTQVGLHFEPVRPRSGRVDIQGDFWIDTASRKLNDIVYLYVGMHGPQRHMPGGQVHFRELANGVPFVDAYEIVMATLAPIRALTSNAEKGLWGAASRNVLQYDVTIGGGVLAHARFPDGTKYDAPLGTALVHAVREDGTPVIGLDINLDSTFYGGKTDSSGNIRIKDMLPGPYSTVIIDTTLDVIGLKLRSPLQFVAVADSLVEPEVLVREAAGALANTCKDKTYTGWAMFVARVSTPDNKPHEGVRWTLGNKFGQTTANGVILPCSRLRVGDKMALRVWRDAGFPSNDMPLEIPFEIKELVTAIKVELRLPEDSKTPPPLPTSPPKKP